MIESLREHGDFSVVYILALDNATRTYLEEHPLDNIQLLSIEDIEHFSPELVAVKPRRTRMEYYFTTTPQLFRYIFNIEQKPNQVVTYLDADLFFYSRPSAILDALGNNSVGITEHRYAHKLESKLSQYGRFNAGFLCIKNDENGVKVLDWWAERALEWCTDVPTEGKYANQGYLNSFPNFEGVEVLQNSGLNLAPWNTRRHHISEGNNSVPQADGDTLVFFHFHGVRKVSKWYVTSQLIYGSPLSKLLKNEVYEPYISKLQTVEDQLKLNGAPAPEIKKRGNGLHGLAARVWKFSMDRISILTGNAIKSN
jgi:hypothetical protein